MLKCKSPATSRTILSTKSSVAWTLLLVWTGLYSESMTSVSRGSALHLGTYKVVIGSSLLTGSACRLSDRCAIIRPWSPLGTVPATKSSLSPFTEPCMPIFSDTVLTTKLYNRIQQRSSTPAKKNLPSLLVR